MQEEDPRVEPKVLLNDQRHYYRCDVNDEGSCLYESATLAILLPALNDYSAFCENMRLLFGEFENEKALSEIFQILQGYDTTPKFVVRRCPQLAALIEQNLRRRVQERILSNRAYFGPFMTDEDLDTVLANQANEWGDHVQVAALAMLLRRPIYINVFVNDAFVQQAERSALPINIPQQYWLPALQLAHVNAANWRKTAHSLRNHYHFFIDESSFEPFKDRYAANNREEFLGRDVNHKKARMEGSKRDKKSDEANPGKAIDALVPYQQLTQKEYEKCTAELDHHYLTEAHQHVTKLIEGYEAHWLQEGSLILLRNQECVTPVLRASDEIEAKRSWCLYHYIHICDALEKISWRQGGTKVRNQQFPWKSISQLKALLEDEQASPHFMDSLLHVLSKDLVELQKRLGALVVQSEIAMGDSSYQAFYEKIKFKPVKEVTKFGLPNIRKVSDAANDLEMLANAIALLKALRLLNPAEENDRESILMLIEQLGEYGTQLSKSTIDACRFPFAEIEGLRHIVAHAGDFSNHTQKIRELVSTNPADLFGELKTDLLSDEQALVNFHAALSAKVEQRKKASDYVGFADLAEATRVEDFTDKSSEKSKQLIDIFVAAIPKDHKDYKEIVGGLSTFLEKIFSGDLPVPQSEDELNQMFYNIQAKIGAQLNIKDWALKTRFLMLNPTADKATKNIAGKIKEKFCDGLKQKKQTHSSQPLGKKPSFSKFQSLFQQEGFRHKTTVEVLDVVLFSIEKIADKTAELVRVHGNDPEKLRVAVGLYSAYHLSVLYHLTIIGQCVRQLHATNDFVRVAPASLWVELEYLRWIRNAIMHHQAMDLSGSLLSYIRNPLLPGSIKHYGGRAYDSHEYLQELKTKIAHVVHSLQSPGAVLVDANHEADVLVREKLKQELRDAVSRESLEKIKILLKSLGFNIKLENWYDPIFQAKDFLGYKDNLELSDIFEHSTSLKMLASKYGLAIETVFGRLVEYGHVKRGEFSGFVVRLENNCDLIKYAKFKQAVFDLLGFELLCITESELKEYFEYADPTKDIEKQKKIISRLSDYRFDTVLLGYELHRAIHSEQLAKVQPILLAKPEMNLRIEGYTPLNLACQKYHQARGAIRGDYLRVIECLLQTGANSDKVDKHKKSELSYAVEHDDVILAKLLLSYGASPDTVEHDDRRPIDRFDCDNPRAGIPGCYVVLMQATNISVQDKLIIAIRARDLSTVQELLARSDIDVNQPDSLGELPIFVAVASGEHQVFQWLFQRGAQLDVINKEGESLLFTACTQPDYYNFYIIKSLLDNGADPNQMIYGAPLFHHILYCPSLVEILPLCVGYKLDINAADNKGCTFLMKLLTVELQRDVPTGYLIRRVLGLGGRLPEKDSLDEFTELMRRDAQAYLEAFCSKKSLKEKRAAELPFFKRETRSEPKSLVDSHPLFLSRL